MVSLTADVLDVWERFWSEIPKGEFEVSETNTR